MYRKYIFFFLTGGLLLAELAAAQGVVRIRPGGRQRWTDRQAATRLLPPFKPSVSVSAGYGYPNVDRIYLPEFYDLYKTGVSQTGPLTASVDYRFSRRMSIGVMVTHGSVSAAYYDYYSSLPVMEAQLENWSFMLNMKRYVPVSKKVTPYIRTAIGVNTWRQDYTDPNGNDMLVSEPYLPVLAYQAGIGATFHLSRHAGLFAEAGYGKYILHGGLSIKL